MDVYEGFFFKKNDFSGANYVLTYYPTAVHLVFEAQKHKHMESADFTEDIINISLNGFLYLSNLCLVQFFVTYQSECGICDRDGL